MKQRTRLPKAEAPIPEPEAVANSAPLKRARKRMAQRNKRIAVTDKHKAEFLERVLAGEFPGDICFDPKMPNYGAMRRAALEDEQFSADLQEAISTLADGTLEDAALFSIEAAEAGDVDSQRIAEIYTRSIIAALEKLAPRTHGAMLKHAGADGGAVAVSIVNYAKTKEPESV